MYQLKTTDEQTEKLSIIVSKRTQEKKVKVEVTNLMSPA